MSELLRLPSGDYACNGRLVPGVTKVLGILNAYARVPRETLALAQQRGKAAHLAVHILETDASGLDWSSVHPLVLPYVQAWEKFKAETQWKTLASEVPVASTIYGYACTPDLFGTLRGIPGVIDCKTGLSPLVGLQLAAQAQAIRECWKLLPDIARRNISPRRYSLLLHSTCTYKLIEHADKADFSTFLAVLQVYQWLAKFAPALVPEETEADWSNFEDPLA